MNASTSVFMRLAGKPHSLSFWVDYALANYREPARQKPITEAIADLRQGRVTREGAQYPMVAATGLS